MTAMSTAKSGYIQRKIVKVCEDIQVTYDNTVRDTSGKIYEFAYGENGYDATKTVPVEGEPQICDVSRLVQRINAIEEGVIEDDLKDEEDEVDIVMSEVPTQNPEVFLLVGKILEMFPYSLVSEEWSVEELKQRLADLQNDEEIRKEKALEDEDEEVLSEDEEEDAKDLIIEEDEEEDEENPEKDENEESDVDYDLSDGGEEVGAESYYDGGDD